MDFYLCMYSDFKYLGCCFVVHVYYEYRKEGEEVLAKGVTKFTAKYFVYGCVGIGESNTAYNKNNLFVGIPSTGFLPLHVLVTQRKTFLIGRVLLLYT